jgi:hypothetical protein
VTNGTYRTEKIFRLMLRETKMFNILFDNLPILMVACLEITSCDKGVNLVTSIWTTSVIFSKLFYKEEDSFEAKAKKIKK